MRFPLALALALVATLARADSAQGELALARLAEELGDAALAARLGNPAGIAEKLRAVRASPHARAPEGLLVPLAALACGRDPQLAPEAAFALLRIAEQLRPSELATRETLLRDLGRAREALACAQASPAPRADIAQQLALAAALLRALP